MHSVFNIESYATSDVGLVRSNNEDVVKTLDKLHFYILADGMGGHNAGEVAADKACEYMCHLIESLPLETLTSKDIHALGEKILSLMHQTNLWVHHLSKQNSDLSGMGTTLCTLLFFGNHIITSHVGDSRIYRMRQGKLSQITDDHLTYKKHLTAEGVEKQKKRALTQAIGTSVKIKPSLSISTAQPNDLLLMCSDGLSDLVKDEEIEKILSTHLDLKDASNFLITLAKTRGGHDNITLLLTKLNTK
ncbi:MAG: Serine/threonine phosphatase stp [Chlamydiia bacterium]|nr:Serine/threonine phosphatase stp [Chlamydiia bacterium]